MRQNITEESGLHNEWYVQAEAQTLATLPEFLRHLTADYTHDYGTICHAIAAGSVATAHAINRSDAGGITGFQASAVMWEFVAGWMSEYKGKPMRLVNYEHMLFPQYEHSYDRHITKDTAAYLQREARAKLSGDCTHVHARVLAHWQQLAEGHIPFGYTVMEEAS